MLIDEELTNEIIVAAIEVHSALGPGLLESAYEECLCFELRLRGLKVEQQVPLLVRCKGMNLDCGYRIDIVVEGRVVLGLKPVEKIFPVHEAQLLTYLKLGGSKVGLLTNCRTDVIRNGIKRMVS